MSRLIAERLTSLIELMNSTTLGKLPADDETVRECFELAMCQKTCDYLLAVGDQEHTIEELKKIYDDTFADGLWEETWAEVFEMSFLMRLPDNEHYIIASIFPGWIEMSVSGPLTEKRRAILNKFIEFWRKLYYANVPHVRHMMDTASMKSLETAPARMTTYVARGSREIALNQPLSSEQVIYTTGEVYQLLAAHKDEISVMNCFCRQYKQMNGGDACEQGIPLEACVTIGAISNQLVENGTARRISFEEACDLMEDFEKKGCIHTAFHYGHNVENEQIAICNCCTDCCELYGAWRKGFISKILVKAHHVPEMIDETRCVGCNACGRKCPTFATYYDKETKKLVFDYDRCVGCGQCVNQCRFDVRRMVPDERNVFVPTREERLPL